MTYIGIACIIIHGFKTKEGMSTAAKNKKQNKTRKEKRTGANQYSLYVLRHTKYTRIVKMNGFDDGQTISH